MKNFIHTRLKHSVILLYTFVYLALFFLLEQSVNTYHIIRFSPDKSVPFIEIFVIPYFLWFVYIAVNVAVFYFFLDIGDFYRLTCYLFLGMSFFLLVSALWPNGLDLRPDVFPRDNIFTDWVKALYGIDTSTNVIPSIHVYNSICVHVAISKNDFFRKHKLLKYSSLVLMVLIIMSTIFIKQHSLLDVGAGILMSILFYPLFYKWNLIPYRKQYPLRNG